jgi:hypothetical protein
VEGRDGAIYWVAEQRNEELVAFLIRLASWTPDAAAVPVCLVLAVAAYLAGDGALANVAIERAITADPENRLADLLTMLFSAGIRPEELGESLRTDARSVARQRRIDLADPRQNSAAKMLGLDSGRVEDSEGAT